MVMSPPRDSLEVGNALPPVAGPKLYPFRHREDRIDFKKPLSRRPNDTKLTGSIGHAHVFKVRIRGENYALKVFKFFDLQQAREDIFPFLNLETDDATFTYHCDPFFAECRAYGRIREIQEQRQADANEKVRRRRAAARNVGTRAAIQPRPVSEIAVQCYGFLGLPAIPYEKMFRERFNVTDWNRAKLDYDRPEYERPPFRALVKQLVEGQKAIVNPAKMLQSLNVLRDGGVYQRDVYARNFLGGLPVDFSIAWTKPHWIFDELIEPNKTTQLDRELYDFDKMMRIERPRTRTRAVRSKMAMRRLRPRNKRIVYGK